METKPQNLSALLRREYDTSGMSLDAAAAKANVARNTFYRAVMGRTDPKWTLALRLLEFFGYEVVIRRRAEAKALPWWGRCSCGGIVAGERAISTDEERWTTVCPECRHRVRVTGTRWPDGWTVQVELIGGNADGR